MLAPKLLASVSALQGPQQLGRLVGVCRKGRRRSDALSWVEGHIGRRMVFVSVF